MAQDKFQSLAPTVQIYKDGEAISARKLGTIVRKIQEGFETLETTIGDIKNRSIIFDDLALFTNSIGRAIGSINDVDQVPVRMFNSQAGRSSQNYGMMRSPWGSAIAATIGDLSKNLLPPINQVDKAGLGCTADTGTACGNSFDTIYTAEKTIVTNPTFINGMTGWTPSGAQWVSDGEVALDLGYQFNSLTYSEIFGLWDITGPVTVTDRWTTGPNGKTNAALVVPSDGSAGPKAISIQGEALALGSDDDWAFSIWLAASGMVDVFLEIPGATAIGGSPEGAVDPATGNYWAVRVSGATPERYYVNGQFPAARTSGIAKLHLGVNNLTSSNPLYVSQAQLEPGKSPTAYRKTTGAAAEANILENGIERDIETVPGKSYQVTIVITLSQVGNLYQDGNVIAANLGNGTHNILFIAAATTTHLKFQHITTTPFASFAGSISEFRVDPATPCHAMNCPGFSAYDATRSYLTTIGKQTIDDSQQYGIQLRLPAGLNDSVYWPDNILGIYDHEKNSAAPTVTTSWASGTWPVANDDNNTSAVFSYDAAPVLGLSNEYVATHNRVENLFTFSSNLELWASTSGTLSPSYFSPNGAQAATHILGPNANLYSVISGAYLLDDLYTISFWARSNSPAASRFVHAQDGISGVISWTPNGSWQNFSYVFSGITRELSGDLTATFEIPTEAELWRPQLVHGSGISSYISTLALPSRKYRLELIPSPTATPSTLPSYGYTLNGLLFTETSGATVTPDSGVTWNVISTDGFPDAGVFRVQSQEYSYKSKTNTTFNSCTSGWRGTPADDTAISSGMMVTNVYLPTPITEIDSAIKFTSPIPAPLRDWENTAGLYLYNTHISNLGRFSIQSTSAPLTKAIGELLTSFTEHITDHRRHFRRDYMCALLADPSSWCAGPETEVAISIPDPDIIEVYDALTVNVIARRFSPTSSKTITVTWGDDQSSTRSATGTIFNGFSHVYDLKAITTSVVYTITVVIEDIDLGFSRRASAQVLVSPITNSAGTITKTSNISRAKMKLLSDFSSISSAKMKAQGSITGTSTAKITV